PGGVHRRELPGGEWPDVDVCPLPAGLPRLQATPPYVDNQSLWLVELLLSAGKLTEATERRVLPRPRPSDSEELATMAQGDRPGLHGRTALRSPRIDLRRAELRDPRFEHARRGADREETSRLLRRARESVRCASRDDEHLPRAHRPTLSRDLEIEAA